MGKWEGVEKDKATESANQLRKPEISYSDAFISKNSALRAENTYFGDVPL